MINENKADVISDAGIENVYIRSVLTCESERGVCAKCYGRNLATGNIANHGEAVGVMAAQSIGEPGTQLTLRTFHIGGTASRIAAQSQITARQSGTIAIENLKAVEQADLTRVAVGRNAKLKLIDANDRVISQFIVPYGATVNVNNGDKVEKGEVLFNWDPYTASIIATTDGTIRYDDIKENVTMREELDDTTGLKQRVIIESRMRNLSPAISIVDDEGNKLTSFILPTRANLQVTDGQKVSAGEVLAKIARSIAKTRDITGGLPRVAELFEARRPKEPAVVSEIDGTVRFGEIRRGIRRIIVTARDGQDERTYLIPYGKHVLIHDGDSVEAGEKLCEGSVAPHDILNILGPNKVQEYLVNEIQEVYRLQGVRINDKHIETIVRQMLQKVKIEDPGDTQYLEGDQVDKIRFLHENEAIRNKVVVTESFDSEFAVEEVVDKDVLEEANADLRKEGKNEAQFRQAVPATFQPLLLGITKASLTTDSFISAASFQETTRVLTDAAISGKKDYLFGLKENVIMGNLIPAGTGLTRYKNVRVKRKSEPIEYEDDTEFIVQ
ncbi:MAG: hypothetical protein DWQ10_03675 [Calditrichaeota bacterium]|nr:MAG: hypothetical protein DWQ10_03675 [Calditrichota bacterium]